jgi:hypothetical protein
MRFVGKVMLITVASVGIASAACNQKRKRNDERRTKDLGLRCQHLFDDILPLLDSMPPSSPACNIAEMSHLMSIVETTQRSAHYCVAKVDRQDLESHDHATIRQAWQVFVAHWQRLDWSNADEITVKVPCPMCIRGDFGLWRCQNPISPEESL